MLMTVLQQFCKQGTTIETHNCNTFMQQNKVRIIMVSVLKVRFAVLLIPVLLLNFRIYLKPSVCYVLFQKGYQRTRKSKRRNNEMITGMEQLLCGKRLNESVTEVFYR